MTIKSTIIFLPLGTSVYFGFLMMRSLEFGFAWQYSLRTGCFFPHAWCIFAGLVFFWPQSGPVVLRVTCSSFRRGYSWGWGSACLLWPWIHLNNDITTEIVEDFFNVLEECGPVDQLIQDDSQVEHNWLLGGKVVQVDLRGDVDAISFSLVGDMGAESDGESWEVWGGEVDEEDVAGGVAVIDSFFYLLLNLINDGDHDESAIDVLFLLIFSRLGWHVLSQG